MAAQTSSNLRHARADIERSAPQRFDRDERTQRTWLYLQRRYAAIFVGSRR
jgi:hypothetical protein